VSENKKYYYLKFKENYFDQDHIKVIESMENGYIYSLVLLKLYLKSLKFDGQLKINEYIPYKADKIEVLSKVIGHDPDHVMHALNLAKDLGIVEIMRTGEIFIADIQNFIGQSSTEGERKKQYRDRLKSCNSQQLANVDKNGTFADKRPPELDIEKELNIELKREIETIIDYLNLKASTSFRSNSKKNISFIQARLNEKWTVDDFKKVIDNKCSQWLRDNKMCIYLRPETLFGTKFESYLNEKINGNVNSKYNDEDFTIAGV